MKYGTAKVEQVRPDGSFVMGKDCSLSPSEMSDILIRFFPSCRCEENRFFTGSFQGERYSIRCKNITYLGNPHPAFKKRIQISDDLSSFYNESKQKGYIPILLGIYSNCGNLLFCDFAIETYVLNAAHNSSAHVHTQDLANATTNGIFSKEDSFGNQITVFTPANIERFLSKKLGISKDQDFRLGIVKDLDAFFLSLKPIWNGIDCYKEMINFNAPNKYQPEWAGFYLEFKFKQYIKQNNLKTISFYQDRSQNGIDLDLFFPTLDAFGDLKAHSNNSGSILGNDWTTVDQVINNKRKHLYYIVLEHDRELDRDHNFAVTEFWNKIQNKADLHSYGQKMKFSATLLNYSILDINANNAKYLSDFNQGYNSDGRPRAKKIMISKSEMKNFLVHQHLLISLKKD